MGKFVMEKTTDVKISKTVRLPIEISNSINEIVDKANKGKRKKMYSFNGFIISACEYALKNMDTDNK